MPKGLPKWKQMDEDNQSACLSAVFAKMVKSQDFSVESLSTAFKEVLPGFCDMQYAGANRVMFRAAMHTFVTESTSEVMVQNRKASALAEHLPTWVGQTAAAAPVPKSPKEKAAAAASSILTDQEAETIIEEVKDEVKDLEKEAADLKSRQEALAAKKMELAAQKKKAEEALKANKLAAEQEKQRAGLKRSLEESVSASSKKAKKSDFKSYFLTMDEESRDELVASGVCSADGDFTQRVALTKKTREEFKNRDLRALEEFGVIEKS